MKLIKTDFNNQIDSFSSSFETLNYFEFSLLLNYQTIWTKLIWHWYNLYREDVEFRICKILKTSVLAYCIYISLENYN